MFSLSLSRTNQIQGAECGDAESLAELITSLHRGKPFDKPLLFCCGESRLDALPSALTEHKVGRQHCLAILDLKRAKEGKHPVPTAADRICAQVPFEEVAVYKTEASETLVAAAARAVVAMAKDHEVALTFFSPSGARALMPAMAAAMNQQGLKSCVHLIALGPSTGMFCSVQGFQYSFWPPSQWLTCICNRNRNLTEAEIATQLEALGDRMLVAGRQTCDAPTAAAVAFCVAKIVSR